MWANKSTYRKHTMTITDLVVSTLPWSRLLWPFSRLYSHFVAVHELVDTDFGLVVVDVKLDVLVHFPFLIRERSHSLPNPRNQDLTTGADKCVWGKKLKKNKFYVVLNGLCTELRGWGQIYQRCRTWEGSSALIKDTSVLLYYTSLLKYTSTAFYLLYTLGPLSLISHSPSD